MVDIKSDNPEVEKKIVSLRDKVLQEGGHLDKDLVLEYKDQGLSISKPGERTQEPIIKIPHHCLVPYEEFSFAIEGQAVVLTSHTDKASPLQVSFLEDILALYNLTDKMNLHHETSPWLAFKEDPDILEHLFQSRQGGDTNVIKKAFQDNKIDDDFTLMTFFKCRTLGSKLNQKNAPKKKVLMPIIDFLNHHMQGAGFQDDYDTDIPFLYVRQKSPIKGSDECFAFYNRFDALDTFLNYGFVDQSANFVRSIPVDIDLGTIGTIKVFATRGHVKQKEIPAALKGLRTYMPITNIYHDEKRAELGHIFIPPQQAQKSLRRILNFAIVMLAPSVGEIERLGYVLQAENVILQKNIKFYENLMGMVSQLEQKDTTIVKMATALAKTQIEKIHLYQSNII